MSLLGFMSVKLDKQQTLLERLNEALLMVQSESLGRAADLGFTLNRFKPRRTLCGILSADCVRN